MSKYRQSSKSKVFLRALRESKLLVRFITSSSVLGQGSLVALAL
jgi:hypothetical protein